MKAKFILEDSSIIQRMLEKMGGIEEFPHEHNVTLFSTGWGPHPQNNLKISNDYPDFIQFNEIAGEWLKANEISGIFFTSYQNGAYVSAQYKVTRFSSHTEILYEGPQHSFGEHWESVRLFSDIEFTNLSWRHGDGSWIESSLLPNGGNASDLIAAAEVAENKDEYIDSISTWRSNPIQSSLLREILELNPELKVKAKKIHGIYPEQYFIN